MEPFIDDFFYKSKVLEIEKAEENLKQTKEKNIESIAKSLLKQMEGNTFMCLDEENGEISYVRITDVSGLNFLRKEIQFYRGKPPFKDVSKEKISLIRYDNSPSITILREIFYDILQLEAPFYSSATLESSNKRVNKIFEEIK